MVEERDNAEKGSDELPEDATALDRQEAAARKIGVRFARDDDWEIWSYLSVGLAIAAAIAALYAAFAGGERAMWFYVWVLPVCGLATVLLSFWGLLRSFLRPPVLRRSRAIAFVLLMGVGYLGIQRPFTPTLSTEEWRSEVVIVPPFEGEWVTLQGGESGDNALTNLPAYRWAFLWAPVIEGKVHSGSGDALEDFHCWDQMVYSPVDGEVVAYENSQPDLPLEEATNQDPRGNHVGIKFGEEAYLFVSNLAEKSIVVRPGEQVERGDPIGKCGRSGLSPYPAVAMHAQNTLAFPVVEGLPIELRYRLDGEVKTGRPSGGPWGETEPKGQRVAVP